MTYMCLKFEKEQNGLKLAMKSCSCKVPINQRLFFLFLAILIFSSFGELWADYSDADMPKVSDDELIQLFENSKGVFDLNVCQRELYRRGKNGKLISGLLDVAQKTDVSSNPLIDKNQNLVFEKIEKSIVVLEDWKASETAPQLLNMLDNCIPGTEGRIIDALSVFQYQPAGKKVAEILGKTKLPLNKIDCLRYMGNLGDKSAIPFIQKELKPAESYPRSDYVQAHAALTLAQLGDFSGHEIVKNLLAGKSFSEVKTAALQTLGIIGDEKDLGLIDQVAQGDGARRDQQVHDYVTIARYLIETKNLTEDQKAEKISKLLNPNNPWAFSWAIREIDKKHSPAALKKLQQAYGSLKFSGSKESDYTKSILNVLKKNGINE